VGKYVGRYLFLLLADGIQLAMIEVELASLGVDCNLEGVLSCMSGRKDLRCTRLRLCF
jgi:hypothetical protein